MEKELSDARQSDLEGLADLQQYLSDVLSSEPSSDFRQSFKPITDGLGLESPKRVEALFSPPPSTTKTPAPAPAPEPEPQAEIPNARPAAPELTRFAKAMNPAPSAEAETQREPETVAEILAVNPPPLPAPSSFRRLLSIFLDQVFVFTLWAIALVITSNALTGFETGFSARLVDEFSNPTFLRFAALEFAAVWLGYLAVCLGILNMTFGMWVWGIRISYGQKADEKYGMRKLMRIFWSFLFYAPVAPLLLLAIRRHGRNLVDVLSGSSVYVSRE